MDGSKEDGVGDERYFRLFVIWLRDAEVFGRYQRGVAAVAARYGGVERSLAPQAVYGDGLALPDIVNVAYANSREAMDEMSDDPEFQAVVPLRSASVDLAFVDGVVERGEISEHGLAARQYLVELARFGPAGAAGYRGYEREAEAFMAGYGYHVERVLRPDGAVEGLPFRPDVVKVAYFDDDAAMDRMHADPGHARLEGELYDEAVAQSLWLVGTART